LDQISVGVKQAPIICADAIEKGIDSTHADINMSSFFKKLIVREIVGISIWEMKADIKVLLLETEQKFDRHMRLKTGINPALMMPGNYARTLFDVKNEHIVYELIESVERINLMLDMLNKFRHLRKIYRSNSPLNEYLEEVKCYKEKAVEMARFLLQYYSYVQWPNYLHKIIEHVQELIENDSGPGSIGMLSGEGNEGGNKVFRYFRKQLKAAEKVMLWGVLKMYCSCTCFTVVKSYRICPR
jgi:hypothetical protein